MDHAGITKVEFPRVALYAIDPLPLNVQRNQPTGTPNQPQQALGEITATRANFHHGRAVVNVRRDDSMGRIPRIQKEICDER
jgi:hypothetical protein